MPSYTEESVASLVRRFDDATIDLAAWNHAAHLVAALVHVRRDGVDAAMGHFRAALPRFLLAKGLDPANYHETVTRAWLVLVARFDAALPTELGLAERAEAVVARFGDKNHLLAHYSRDRIMSPEARLVFVTPDLCALDVDPG